MSGGLVDVHFSALEECGNRARRVASRLDLDDAFSGTDVKAPSEQVSGSIFGDLTGAGELADQVEKVWKALKGELKSGQSRLAAVERSIDQVESNLRKAGKASGA
ncbi:hypothetical protein HII36_53770 [Nonomuraea sp. NN258]|uniref:hypothetical protein n=1 Tax=Nonomuraea antri TaxID=2730852 RepID=UPI0015689E18|nr:hypothetical protein [Nonomuraea antri]NRQ40623.1 hypothetical protein [Nonomuraea antri]